MTASFYGRVVRKPPAITPEMKANIERAKAEAEATAAKLQRALAELELATAPRA